MEQISLNDWRKASYSLSYGECIEIATRLSGGVIVRDSKSPDGPTVNYSLAQWRVFVYKHQN